MLSSYAPALVFIALGVIVGVAFALLNVFFGAKPKKGVSHTTDPYESGMSSDVTQGFRFGISFYLIAMLFILFDIEVVFLYPVGVIINAADSVFVLVELMVFIFLLMVALVYVWRRGALEWK